MNITDTDLQTLEMMGGAVNSGRPDAAQSGRTIVSLRNEHIGWYNDFIRRAHGSESPDVNPINLGKLGIGATPWTMIAPGQVAFFEATADGLVSCSAQASFYCWGNVSASAPGTFPDDPAVTAAASATAPRLVIKAGQFYTMKHDAPSTISMHASIEG